LNQADAQSATVVQQARLASANYITNVVVEAKRFNDLLGPYQSNPGLLTQQYFLQTLSQVLTNAEKWVEPTSDSGRPTEVRLQLNREPVEQRSPAGP
jgi:hypothetical protein